MPRGNLRVVSSYIGGGFGCKLWVRSDVVMAALGARAAVAGQGRAGAAADRQQHHAQAGDHPAHPHRRRSRRRDRLSRMSWSGDLPGELP